jgi:glycerol uptake facilitator-like aquaporin
MLPYIAEFFGTALLILLGDGVCTSDVGPRIAHAILPIAGKGGSDWGYAWVPIVGPIIGGVLGVVSYKALLG